MEEILKLIFINLFLLILAYFFIYPKFAKNNINKLVIYDLFLIFIGLLIAYFVVGRYSREIYGLSWWFWFILLGFVIEFPFFKNYLKKYSIDYLGNLQDNKVNFESNKFIDIDIQMINNNFFEKNIKNKFLIDRLKSIIEFLKKYKYKFNEVNITEPKNDEVIIELYLEGKLETSNFKQIDDVVVSIILNTKGIFVLINFGQDEKIIEFTLWDHKLEFKTIDEFKEFFDGFIKQGLVIKKYFLNNKLVNFDVIVNDKVIYRLNKNFDLNNNISEVKEKLIII